MSVSLPLSSSFVDVVLCFRIKSGGRMVRTRSQSNRIALRIHLNYYTLLSIPIGWKRSRRAAAGGEQQTNWVSVWKTNKSSRHIVVKQEQHKTGRLR